MTDRENFDNAFMAWVNSPDRGLTLVNREVQIQIEWKAWQAALASQQPADDEWLHWNGGRALPPVESMQRVQVKLRNGDVREHYAQNFAWRNAPTKRGVDIIAYRVVKP